MKSIPLIHYTGMSWLVVAVAFLQFGSSAQIFAQDLLQQKVFAGTDGGSAGVSCSNSNNGTAHMLCLEELANPNGSTPLLGGVSWQAPNSPAVGTLGADGAPVETTGVADQMASISMPNGLFTSTPGCAATTDGSGTVICALEGSNNGLYGIAIHPQPRGSGQTAAGTTSHLVPLLTPGQFLTAAAVATFEDLPCSGANPCNQVVSIASHPSCAATEANMVICAVVVLMQNSAGTSNTILVGLAFDPRIATSATNPKIQPLELGNFFHSNPSCASSKDPNGSLDGGNMFATCAIVFQQGFFGGTAELFAGSFDPRSGFTQGSLSDAASGQLGDPSCATPADSSGAVICAIGENTTGSFTSLLGVAFNPVTKTTKTLNLGAPPSGDGAWVSWGCASPVDGNDQNNAHISIACAAVTTNNEILSINFDPRTGHDPVTGASPAFATVNFTDPNGSSATLISPPSCVPENVIHNQITCAIVDSFNDSIGFAATIE
jgi:hypothetical protein